MGKQTGVIIVAFASAHLALVLCAICMSTHYWLEAEHHNNTHHNHTNTTLKIQVNRTTNLTYTKGLWQCCLLNKTTIYHHGHLNHTTNKTVGNETTMTEIITETCHKTFMLHNMTLINKHNHTGNHTSNNNGTMFRVVQVTYCIGLGCLCFGTILMYVILFTESFKRSVPIATTKIISLFLAGTLIMTALVINGQHYPDDPDFSYLTDFGVFLGWSFYVGVAGNVIVYISAIVSTYNLALMRSSAVPYENLYINT